MILPMISPSEDMIPAFMLHNGVEYVRLTDEETNFPLEFYKPYIFYYNNDLRKVMVYRIYFNEPAGLTKNQFTLDQVLENRNQWLKIKPDYSDRTFVAEGKNFWDTFALKKKLEHLEFNAKFEYMSMPNPTRSNEVSKMWLYFNDDWDIGRFKMIFSDFMPL